MVFNPAVKSGKSTAEMQVRAQTKYSNQTVESLFN